MTRLCPGPDKDPEVKIWWCDGHACPVRGIPSTCKLSVEQRGYEMQYTPRGKAAEKQYIKERDARIARLRSEQQ